VLDLLKLGSEIASKRRTLELSQSELARRARVSRPTLAALENGRTGELGFTKITNILFALGLELRLQDASSQRPTLDQLLKERDDQDLD
jgi:transcriptional regulator with XRE-family HTH domain